VYILFPGTSDALILSCSEAAISMPLCDALAVLTLIAYYKTFQKTELAVFPLVKEAEYAKRTSGERKGKKPVVTGP
jgi:hypothetical protein